jgi:3-oxoacyl-[acyl-carrier protein] reductase
MPTVNDHQRTALITGGSGGIGAAIVDQLAGEGYRVVFTYCQAEDSAKALEASHAAQGRSVTALRLDQADLVQIDALFREARRALGESGEVYLDVLMNAAGIFDGTPMAQGTAALYDRVMAVNAKAVYFMMQHAARHLRDNGRIINLSTIGTRWPSPGEALYAASKAAVEQFSRVASRELGSRGITVNVVAPGPTDTAMLRTHSSEDQIRGATYMTALGRLGQPRDVAHAVALLASPQAGWMTGQVIAVDGGLT